MIIIINKDFSISSSYMLILVIKLYERGGAGGLCWVEGMGVGELAGVVFHSAVVFCCD